MARSSTTGIYTRVDNSFSNPVLGTTISPTDADTFFDDVENAMNAFQGTSTTSLAIATGSKTFTVAGSISTKAFLPGTQIRAFSLANSANFMDCTVVSYSTSTGALVTTCFAIGGSGTLTDWVILSAGARGGSGPIAGFRQLYDSTTTDADPGAGDFRLNHATPASATEVYFDNVDTGGSSLTTILDALDDHGNSAARGILRAEKDGDSSVWGQWLLSGSVTDGTGYRKATLSGGSGSGAFTAADPFRWAFYPKGADGTVGGTTGTDDNRLIRADGTGGGTAQASAITVDDSGNVTGVGTLDIGNADTTLARSAAGIVTVEGTPLKKAGKETIWIPAVAMWARTTNGPAAASRELTTGGDIMVKGLAFDATTEEGAQFYIAFPKSWDKGTITFQAFWTNVNGLTTETVSWGLSVGAFTDSDAIDSTDLGTEVRVADTWLAANDLHVSAESGAVTVGNTPIDDDLIIGQIVRSVANDNMTGDAELMGIKIFFTTSAATDA